MPSPANASTTLSTIGPNLLFLIMTLLANYISWMNLKAPDFFGIVNHRLEYEAIEGLSMPIYIFSFSKFTNLSNKALGTRIGFKSHGTYNTVNITIDATMLLAHFQSHLEMRQKPYYVWRAYLGTFFFLVHSRIHPLYF